MDSQRSGTLETPNLALLRPSLPSALAALNQDLPEESQLHHTFIIGGASLYAEALSLPAAKRIIITRVLSPAYEQCDVFFPDFQSLDSRWRQASHQEMEDWTGLSIPQGIQEERGTTYEYQMWRKLFAADLEPDGSMSITFREWQVDERWPSEDQHSLMDGWPSSSFNLRIRITPNSVPRTYK
ncbi:dihydrofolate reductase [Tulasnella sp. 403]|nr:dihydrofolate reductase [Tulasnella sp. 403]